jgi:hypothetical protein
MTGGEPRATGDEPRGSERGGRERHPVAERSGWRGHEDGVVAGAEALLLGVLVFVFGTLVLLNGWLAIDARFATAAAAREAVRAVTTAEAGADLATAAATAGRAALGAHGIDPSRASIALVAGDQRRCAEVRAVVTLEVPLVVIPSLRGRTGSLSVRSDHRAVVDPHRSGLPEGVVCDF